MHWENSSDLRTQKSKEANKRDETLGVEQEKSIDQMIGRILQDFDKKKLEKLCGDCGRRAETRPPVAVRNVGPPKARKDTASASPTSCQAPLRPKSRCLGIGVLAACSAVRSSCILATRPLRLTHSTFIGKKTPVVFSLAV